MAAQCEAIEKGMNVEIEVAKAGKESLQDCVRMVEEVIAGRTPIQGMTPMDIGMDLGDDFDFGFDLDFFMATPGLPY